MLNENDDIPKTQMVLLNEAIENIKLDYQIDKQIDEIRFLKYPFHPKGNYKKIHESIQKDMVFYYNNETFSLAIYNIDYVYEMSKGFRKYKEEIVSSVMAKHIQNLCLFKYKFPSFKPTQINTPFPGTYFKRSFYCEEETSFRYFINEKDKLFKFYIPSKEDVFLNYLYQLLRQEEQSKQNPFYQKEEQQNSPSIFSFIIESTKNKSIKITLDCRTIDDFDEFLYIYDNIYKEFEEDCSIPYTKYQNISVVPCKNKFSFYLNVLLYFSIFYEGKYFTAAQISHNGSIIYLAHKKYARAFKEYDRPARKLKCFSKKYS